MRRTELAFSQPFGDNFTHLGDFLFPKGLLTNGNASLFRNLSSRSFHRRWVKILDIPLDNPSAVTRSFNQRNIHALLLGKLLRQRRGFYPAVIRITSAPCTVLGNFFLLLRTLWTVRWLFLFLRLCRSRGF